MTIRKKISEEQVVKIFKSKKILTLPEVQSLLECSRFSAKHHIKKYGAVTSFNHNSKYYSLPEIMNFDNLGLWEYNDIRFSKYGTLKKTLTGLISHSESGLDSVEIRDLMQYSLSGMLAKLVAAKCLNRKKMAGRYIYFSIEDVRFNQQYQKRKQTVTEAGLLACPAKIFSLVERINRPDISDAEINRLLGKRNIPAPVASIQSFFSENNINNEFPVFADIVLLRSLLDRALEPLLTQSMFAVKPNILFDANHDLDQCCGTNLNQYKSRTRNVYTLHIGGFIAYEKLVMCNVCGAKYKSEELSAIIPEGSSYGYDVMVCIGELMFFEHKQANEIKLELQNRNIPISISEVEYLSKKFIIYLSAVQEENNTGIVEMMNANGGYILHIDALGGTKGGQRLISGVDGISDFVLGNAKIKSEHSDYVRPFLETIKTRFGHPLAIVQDMGRGIMKAVREVFPDVKILICHFHFLRDIGKDLLGDNYDIIRKRLRHFGFLTTLRNLSKELKLMFENSPNAVDAFYQLCNSNETGSLHTDTQQAIYLYTLIEWILDWKSQSNGYGFPFDRPHLDLALRVTEAVRLLDADSLSNTGNNNICKLRSKLYVILNSIIQDTALNESIDEINSEILIFEKLRKAMRIAPENGTDGLNDDGSKTDIKAIEKAVNIFIAEQEKTGESMNNTKFMAFFKQLYKYREQLFSDPIIVETAEGIKTIQPQRTNNLMERMFRDFTRDNKRKTGVNSIGNTIRAMVADTPLIRNLKNDNYRKIIMGEKENLAEVFASIDIRTIREKMNEHAICNEKIPKKIKALLKEDELLGILTSIGRKM